MWWQSETQIVMKLKNSSFDETKNLNGDEIQKLKLWWNRKKSNGNETQKLKLWWDSKAQIGMNLKNINCDETQIVIKLKNSNNVETLNLIVIKLKISNCDET